MTRVFAVLMGVTSMGVVWVINVSVPAAIGSGSEITPAQKNLLQKSAAVPEVAGFEDLTVARAEIVADIPLDAFTHWFDNAELQSILPGTKDVPAVIRTELLTRAWAGPGSRRRVVLSDGGEALEQVLVKDLPRQFLYVVWNYSTDAARHLRYGVGQFRLTEAEGGRTRIEWTYGFAPRNPVSGYFIAGFANGVWTEWMSAALTAIKVRSEQSLRR